MLNSICWGE